MKSDATRKALSNALKQLLQKRPIHKITINDLTSECGISRMTFYYHFRDIYDLAEWTMQDTLGPVLGENTDHGRWQQGFLALLNVLKENQALVLNIYQSMDRDMIERYMRREVTNLLLPVVQAQAKELHVSKAGMESVARFYSYALMGVVMEWVSRSMQTDPQELTASTAAMIQGGFRNSLENLARSEQAQQLRAQARRTGEGACIPARYSYASVAQ